MDEPEIRDRPSERAPRDRNGSPVFVARGLTKIYGTGAAPLYALRDIDLEIRQGEFLVLLGPSGSGKSTLLTFLAGSMRRHRAPPGGEITSSPAPAILS